MKKVFFVLLALAALLTVSCSSGPLTYKVQYYDDDLSLLNEIDWPNGQTLSPDYYVPTKTGYLFGGWYYDISLQEQFTGSKPITSNTKLYASWYKGELAANVTVNVDLTNLTIEYGDRVSVVFAFEDYTFTEAVDIYEVGKTEVSVTKKVLATTGIVYATVRSKTAVNKGSMNRIVEFKDGDVYTLKVEPESES